ncbi:Gcd10p-domain-containing protein [Violaceomyces palustris]|uniref:Gcd10p-domain-containing protein n=1 Tax=Violaceomyces palustris TaxID=1673888 RepID=A0ACD0P1B6_9BASI|nr:Gcd10p-domain-containing protein [Violaceomyces palustris]
MSADSIEKEQAGPSNSSSSHPTGTSTAHTPTPTHPSDPSESSLEAPSGSSRAEDDPNRSKPQNRERKPACGDGLKPNRSNNNTNNNSKGKNLAELTSEQLRSRITFIPSGQQVLLKLPSERLKPIVLQPGKNVSIGKFGSFKADELIGMPFGYTYEIAERGGGLSVVVDRTLAEIEATDATNENINDDGDSQKLTYVDIKAFKDAGLDGREIIKKQLEMNSSYDQRTAFSQAKYVKRKEQKHLKLFTPLPPDTMTIASYNFEKNSEKIRWMRPDALSQCLSFASIRPGGKYLVVDGISGLLVGAILERLGGEGSLIAINDTESPPAFDLLDQFNLPPQLTKNVLRTMHWAMTEKDYIPIFSGQEGLETSSSKKDKDKGRNKKRQALQDESARLRKDFQAGDFDAVIIASPYEPFSMIQRLRPYLGGSANIVVHSPYLQSLVECHARLRQSAEYINVSITEPWLRRYQVLPGRTHPEMTTSATAGYILHAIRVLTEEEALAMREKERAKLEAEDIQGSARPRDGEQAEIEAERDTKRPKIEGGKAEETINSSEAIATMDVDVASSATAPPSS